MKYTKRTKCFRTSLKHTISRRLFILKRAVTIDAAREYARRGRWMENVTTAIDRGRCTFGGKLKKLNIQQPLQLE